jgi:dienelactone hydrolase
MTNKRSSPTSDFGSPEAETGCQELRDRLKRSAYLRHLLEVYHSDEDDKPHDAPFWEMWLRESGELPPDFDALPTNAFLPDVLTFNDGRVVRTPEEWRQRRQEVLDILEYYQLGRWPPPPPKMVAEELDSTQDDALQGTVKHVRLVYGPSAKAVAADTRQLSKDACVLRSVHLNVEVFIPDGQGPFPAVVEVEAGSGWGGHLSGYLSSTAAKRGYVVCTFNRLDAFTARDVYPDYEYNQLGWWAYAASRCIDYLYRLDEVDQSKVAVIGHSRGGKMSLIAAALDERIAAAIPSHTGSAAGTVPPWRYMGEKYGAETLEASTRLYPYWNHPRMRFFAGRENKLPFDSHFLMALVAPKALLVTEGDADDVGEPWGAQQAYLATKKVYELLGQPERCNIAFSSGGHRLAEEVKEQYVDWLDMQFGRRSLDFSEELMYTYTFDKWREVVGETVDVTSFPEKGLDDLLVGNDGAVIQTREAWLAKKEAIKERILWGLGELSVVKEVYEAKLVDVRKTDIGLMKATLPIEGKLVGHLTYPAETDGKLPVVIYLHAYLDALGYDWPAEYGWTPSVGERLARKGFLAVEYDQFGYGTRNHDCGIEFYAEHPRQSAMGVMVQDVRRAIGALSSLDIADQDRIMVAGFSLGGAVGLHAAALDERIQAVASTCGFASMRLDAHGNETEGLRRYSHLRPTLPRLGFFVGYERNVPYDFHEILSLIAPRPVLVLAPTLDQDWFYEDVEACTASASAVYQLLGSESNLQLHAPLDFNRYPPRYQNTVHEWLFGIAESL